MDEARIRVVELFAGVGGFRLGLDGGPESDSVGDFETIWSNQWEPSTKRQHANEVYLARWPEQEYDYQHSSNNIEDEVDNVPEHDVLVGGFPCQDYSVAASGRRGIQGKKGVLWWELSKVIQLKMPKYILLENVDRLLKSPASQRGRDLP